MKDRGRCWAAIFFSSRRRHTRWTGDWSSDVCSSDLGEYEEVDVPPEYQDRFTKYSEALIESIAATDDTLLERYLGGEEIGRDEAIAAMKAGMARGELDRKSVV